MNPLTLITDGVGGILGVAGDAVTGLGNTVSSGIGSVYNNMTAPTVADTIGDPTPQPTFMQSLPQMADVYGASYDAAGGGPGMGRGIAAGLAASKPYWNWRDNIRTVGPPNQVQGVQSVVAAAPAEPAQLGPEFVRPSLPDPVTETPEFVTGSFENTFVDESKTPEQQQEAKEEVAEEVAKEVVNQIFPEFSPTQLIAPLVGGGGAALAATRGLPAPIEGPPAVIPQGPTIYRSGGSTKQNILPAPGEGRSMRPMVDRRIPRLPAPQGPTIVTPPPFATIPVNPSAQAILNADNQGLYALESLRREAAGTDAFKAGQSPRVLESMDSSIERGLRSPEPIIDAEWWDETSRKVDEGFSKFQKKRGIAPKLKQGLLNFGGKALGGLGILSVLDNPLDAEMLGDSTPSGDAQRAGDLVAQVVALEILDGANYTDDQIMERLGRELAGAGVNPQALPFPGLVLEKARGIVRDNLQAEATQSRNEEAYRQAYKF